MAQAPHSLGVISATMIISHLWVTYTGVRVLTTLYLSLHTCLLSFSQSLQSSTASASAPWLRCSPLWKRGQSEAGCLGQHEPPKAPSEPYERFQADKAPDDAGVPVQTGP